MNYINLCPTNLRDSRCVLQGVPPCVPAVLNRSPSSKSSGEYIKRFGGCAHPFGGFQPETEYRATHCFVAEVVAAAAAMAVAAQLALFARSQSKSIDRQTSGRRTCGFNSTNKQTAKLIDSGFNQAEVHLLPLWLC